MNPQPTPTSSALERDIFLSALGLVNPAERAAYLKTACGADAVLLDRVSALLREQETVGSFLIRPAVAGDPPRQGPHGTAYLATVTEKPGDRIGRYKLLEQLGEGGWGVVYMAEQVEPVRRRVALKIIRLGMDTKSVIARFEAERQALAMMEHPNIAKVLDAGATETGRPYFVMELVRGIRITDYCDQNSLSTEERLRLFIEVCQAIQHAHQKGIIHRDIKPSNILITLHDGVPVPKVIDFGIAKAIPTMAALTDKTLFTEFSTFIGTPAYTSPEQAEMSGLDIDTRSDIYALGVLLYELLTGKTPFDADALFHAGIDECRRKIREDEPAFPSSRLATMIDSELTSTAKHRRIESVHLIHLLQGDLDWIAMKCLEKDRTRRYETATGLAQDVRRYLEGEPVLARPPSAAYRLRKFVRRHKGTVTAVVAITLILFLAVIVSSWQAVQATRAEQEQRRLRTVAEKAQLNEAKERARAESEEQAALRKAYNSDMNLLHQALAANNHGRVVDLLNRHQPAQGHPDFRQWEWRYFWNQARSDAAFALPSQDHGISDIALSPNGRLMATCDRRGTLQLWDWTSRTVVAVLRERAFGSHAFAFSRDGTRIAAAFPEGPRRTEVKIWGVTTRQIIAEWAHDGGVEALQFGSDDTTLLTIGQDLAVRTWNLETKTSEERIPAPSREWWRRKTAAFSADGSLVAMARSGRIEIWDVATGTQRSSAEAFEGEIASLEFSPDGSLLAASPLFTGTSTSILLLSTETGQTVGELHGHVSWIPDMTFTPDGRHLLSAGADQTIRVWHVQERREVDTLRGHRSEINCVAVTPDGHLIVSGSRDGTLFGWHAERESNQSPFETLPVKVSSLDFLKEQQTLLSVNADGTVSLWDSETLRETERLESLGNEVARLVPAPDGSQLYVGHRNGSIQVVDWASRLVITNLARPRRGFSQGPLELIDGGRTLVTLAPNSIVNLIDTATFQTKASWKMDEGPPFFQARPVLSADGRYLLVSSFGGSIRMLDLQTGETEEVQTLPSGGIFSMTYSPDGKLLAIGSPEGLVNLWDPQTRQIVEVLRGHLIGVHSVAFSPDGQRLASGSHGNEAIKLWDVATWHEVATLAGEGLIVNGVKFSPDGRLLTAVNAQGKAQLWRAPLLEDIAATETQLTKAALNY